MCKLRKILESPQDTFVSPSNRVKYTSTQTEEKEQHTFALYLLKSHHQGTISDL